MANNPEKYTYPTGDAEFTRQEIAITMASDGFLFVAFEEGWSDEIASDTFHQLGDIDSRLTDEDCETFVKGLLETKDDGELFYQHVKDFTREMLSKWGLITPVCFLSPNQYARSA